MLRRSSDIISIPLNHEMSCKMTDQTQHKLYAIQISRYGKPFSYRILQNSNGYQLISNIDDKITKPANRTYSFVIIPDENLKPTLRICNSGHYFLAGKVDFVYAAGDITFENGQITAINDQSGAYHLNINDMSNDQLENYIASFKRALSDVGLPDNHFQRYQCHLVDQPEKAQPTANMTISIAQRNRFFSCQSALIITASSVMLATLYMNNLYGNK